MAVYEGNQLFALINRLRGAFVGRDEMAGFFGGLDLTPAAQQITIANNTTAAPFVSNSNFSGLIVINDLVTGSTGLIVAGGAATQVIADTLGSTFSATAGAASRISVYYTAFPNYVLTIENKIGAARTLIVAPIRTRTGA